MLGSGALVMVVFHGVVVLEPFPRNQDNIMLSFWMFYVCKFMMKICDPLCKKQSYSPIEYNYSHGTMQNNP